MRLALATVVSAGIVAGLVACGESSSRGVAPPSSAAALEARAPSKAELQWIGGLERWYDDQHGNTTLSDCRRSLDRDVPIPPTATLRAIRARVDETCRVFESSNALQTRALDGHMELFDDASAGFRRAEGAMEEVFHKLDIYRADVDRPLPRFGGTGDTTRIHPGLSSAASRLLGRHVEIRCWSAAEWRALETVKDALAFAELEGQRAHFSAADCARLVRLGHRSGRYVGDAWAYVAFFHELEHLKGVMDEAAAECVAMQLAAGGAPALRVGRAEGRRLARAYLSRVFPHESPEYRSSQCRSGGGLDVDPDNPRWP